MIGNKHIRKSGSENANGSFSVEVVNIPECEGCAYYNELNSGSEQKICHYLLIEGHSRGCDLGAACTKRKDGEFAGLTPSKWCHDGREL